MGIKSDNTVINTEISLRLQDQKELQMIVNVIDYKRRLKK